MDASRRAHVNALRERVSRAGYPVNPEAVAGAIVARLATITERPGLSGPARSGRRRPAQAGSGDVLETP